MQGWIIAWRYVGVWFPQQLCTELYNPLGTTAGSWRRAHIDIRGEKNARLSSPPNFGRMLHMQDHSRNLTVLFSCSLVLLTTLENAGTVTWDEMRRPEAERSISNKAASQVGGDSPDTGWGGPARGGTCSEILALSSAACSESVSGVVAQLGLGKTSWVKLLSLLTLETVAMGPLFELQLQICPHPKIYIYIFQAFIHLYETEKGLLQ